MEEEGKISREKDTPKKNLKKKTTNETNLEHRNLDKQNKTKLEEKLKTIDSNLVDEEQKDESLEAKLQHQLEFYFGDVNLRKDKFLREQIAKNDKGYVELSVFLGFNKIKSLLMNFSEQKDKIKVIANAVENSDLLYLNTGRTKVKRKIPFSDEVTKKDQTEIDKRTIYVENFPEDMNHEMIAKIFSKCGKILHVSLPRYAESKTIKGFGFVEFSNEEEAKVALGKYNNTVPSELVEKSLFKGKINPLKVITKQQWLELKEEFKKIKKELVQHLQGNSQHESHSSKGPELHKGCLIRLKNLPEDIDKTVLRTTMSSYCTPKYVDYKKGSNECIVRFENENLRHNFEEKYSNEGLLIQNKKVDIEIIEGEEEDNYLNRVKHYQDHLRNRNSSKNKGDRYSNQMVIE